MPKIANFEYQKERDPKADANAVNPVPRRDHSSRIHRRVICKTTVETNRAQQHHCDHNLIIRAIGWLASLVGMDVAAQRVASNESDHKDKSHNGERADGVRPSRRSLERKMRPGANVNEAESERDKDTQAAQHKEDRMGPVARIVFKRQHPPQKQANDQPLRKLEPKAEKKKKKTRYSQSTDSHGANNGVSVHHGDVLHLKPVARTAEGLVAIDF